MNNSYVRALLYCAYLSEDNRGDFDLVALSIFETNSLRLLLACVFVQVVNRPENTSKLMPLNLYENTKANLKTKDLFYLLL